MMVRGQGEHAMLEGRGPSVGSYLWPRFPPSCHAARPARQHPQHLSDRATSGRDAATRIGSPPAWPGCLFPVPLRARPSKPTLPKLLAAGDGLGPLCPHCEAATEPFRPFRPGREHPNHHVAISPG